MEHVNKIFCTNFQQLVLKVVGLNVLLEAYRYHLWGTTL